MNKPMHDRIYLLPEDGVWCWAEHSSPGVGQSNDDAVEYVRADLFDQVVAQRDSFMSQLETLKTALDKDFQMLREHSDRLHVENCDIKRVNAELLAQVEVRDALLRNISSWIGKLPVPTKSATSYMLRIDGVIKETPAACLAQVKADAGRAGYLAALGADFGAEIDGVHDEAIKLANQYAERIRQEVV